MKEKALKLLGLMRRANAIQPGEDRAGDTVQAGRAKLLLLKAILDRSNVLLLDEPTRNFSPLSCPAVRKLLSEFPGCILAVSHDRKFIEEVTPTLYTLTAEGLQRIYR